MNVVTAVTLGLKVLVFLQELEKNKLKDTSQARQAAKNFLDASDNESEEIAVLVNSLDPGFLHEILQSVGGVLRLADVFNKKD
jgi:hypothetical protein